MKALKTVSAPQIFYRPEAQSMGGRNVDGALSRATLIDVRNREANAAYADEQAATDNATAIVKKRQADEMAYRLLQDQIDELERSAVDRGFLREKQSDLLFALPPGSEGTVAVPLPQPVLGAAWETAHRIIWDTCCAVLGIPASYVTALHRIGGGGSYGSASSAGLYAMHLQTTTNKWRELLGTFFTEMYRLAFPNDTRKIRLVLSRFHADSYEDLKQKFQDGVMTAAEFIAVARSDLDLPHSEELLRKLIERQKAIAAPPKKKEEESPPKKKSKKEEEDDESSKKREEED